MIAFLVTPIPLIHARILAPYPILARRCCAYPFRPLRREPVLCSRVLASASLAA